MFKPVVIVYVPKKYIEKCPKEKQCENQMFDYRFAPTNADEIWCKTKAKSLWYYAPVIFQDLISIAEGIIYKNKQKTK